MELIENRFVGGAFPSPVDKRDYKYSDIARDSTPFDWNVGYDIRKVLPVIINNPSFVIKPKDQNGSGSCGGQAQSAVTAIKEALMTKTYEERSAKFIYSQTYVTGGGTRGRDLCNLVINKGSAKEIFCSSYDNGQPPSEEFMEKTSDITSVAYQDAQSTTALSYANVDADIDKVAQAIRDNGAVLLGVTGQNGKDWLKTYPQAPDHRDWGHWICACGAMLINEKKYILILNSWGDTIGEAGFQYLGEDYFNASMSGTDSGKAVWEGWTLVLKVVDAKEETTSLLRTLIVALVNFFKPQTQQLS